MTMIDTAMGALRATAAKALGLSGRLTETCSRAPLTNPDEASAIISRSPVAGRRSPVAGRRSPVAGRRSPVAGRLIPARVRGAIT